MHRNRYYSDPFNAHFDVERLQSPGNPTDRSFKTF